MGARPKPAKHPARPASDEASPQVSAIEERGLALVKELARVGRGTAPPSVKLEGMLEILFGAFSGGDEPFRRLLLDGWIKGRQEKDFRLAMAWLREQMRLCVEEILIEGIAAGAFREDVDPASVAAICVGAAEGYLLQSRDEEGAVPPGQLVRAVLGLVAPPGEH